MWSNGTSFKAGELLVDGISARKLADQFGTPLFVLEKADFVARALLFQKALDESFGENAGEVYYASKAFICKEVARWIKDLGIGIDVATGGELAVALAGGIAPKKIQVHGNNKSLAEIERAVSLEVGSIVIDSLQEIERISETAQRLNKIAKVFIRVTPGVEAHTHESIKTAHEDVKFGLSIASGAAWQAVEKVVQSANLELVGIHAHIGSQILGTDAFRLSAERLIGFLARYRDAYGKELAELDLGGGYGIAYLPGDQELGAREVIPALKSAVAQFCTAHGLQIPRISIEPGRAIVGPSMLTLYEVGTTKDVILEDGSVRRYISVDGGMSDNIRPALYGAQYFAQLANRTSDAAPVSSRIVGKHCESGDIVIHSIDLPGDVQPGDLIAMPATGAYGYSMANNYNKVPRPPVVCIENGSARIIVRRETEADLLALDI